MEKTNARSASPTSSVTREKVSEMDFYAALKQVLTGKKIHRSSWPVEEYGFLSDGILMIHIGGLDHYWTISDGDMNGIDWITV